MKETVQNVRVLMVDDNADGLVARKAVLEEIGYQVTSCTTGARALEELDRVKFDLVIADFRMPDMDGVELIRAVRQRQGAVPVIMISGFVDAMGLREDNTGADVVIQKSANEVQQMIRAARNLLRPGGARKTVKSARPPAVKSRRHQA